MAIATGTAMFLAAAATAAGNAGSAAMQSRAAGRAASGQQKSTGAAFRYQRDRDAEEKRRYDLWQADFKRAFEQREAVRRELLKRRFGITVPPMAPAATATGGLSLGTLAGPSPSASDTPALVPNAQDVPQAQGMTLGDLSGWSDWRRYSNAP